MRVAVLEDDPVHADTVTTVVKALGHECLLFDSGLELQSQLERDSFDLLILDWSVPGMTGYEIVEWVRSNVEHRVPVLFVTGHASEREIVAALTAGADDYMVKPVRVAEMLARITALLRRSYPRTQSSITTFGRYTFDSATCTVTAGDMAVVLKDKEFRLAFLLFANLGRLLSRSYLVQAVWGTALSPGSRSLDTHLSRVRSALALRPENGMRLSAVYSHGYRLESLSAVASEAHLPGLTEDVTKNEAER